jgi:hypothetical protein
MLSKFALILCGALLLQACSSQPTIVFKDQSPSVGLLDRQFSEIKLRGPIQTQITHVFDALRADPPYHFESYTLELQQGLDPHGKAVDDFFAVAAKHDHRINVHLRDVTLREVFDAMVSQAGWDWENTHKGVLFIVGDHVPRPYFPPNDD